MGIMKTFKKWLRRQKGRGGSANSQSGSGVRRKKTTQKGGRKRKKRVGGKRPQHLSAYGADQLKRSGIEATSKLGTYLSQLKDN